MKLVLPVQRKISQKISSKMTFYQYQTANTSVFSETARISEKTRVFVYLIFFFHDIQPITFNLLNRIERLRYLYTKTYEKRQIFEKVSRGYSN